MVEIKNEKRMNVGDNVWWIDNYGNLQNGKIYEVREDKGVVWALIEQGRNGGMKTGAKMYKCWQSKDECLEAEAKRSKGQKEAYKESIKDVNDLVKFLYANMDRTEYRDCEAEVAARERAKELLDIDVEVVFD